MSGAVDKLTLQGFDLGADITSIARSRPGSGSLDKSQRADRNCSRLFVVMMMVV
jgi:hypothetical protein